MAKKKNNEALAAIAEIFEAMAKEAGGKFFGVTESIEKPKEGESWVHSSWGGVVILRRWNENESVAEVGRRRMILQDSLMIGRFGFVDEKNTTKGFSFIKYTP